MRRPSHFRKTCLLLALGLNAGPALAQPSFFGSTPRPNSLSHPPASNIRILLTTGLQPAPTAGQGVKVFSVLRGGQRAGHSGTAAVDPATPDALKFVSAAGQPFLAGETVSVSLTDAITNTSGQALAPPAVFSFTTATGGTGRGTFRGTATIGVLVGGLVQVQLADLDGDGDLDAVGTLNGPGTVEVLLNGGNGAGGGTGSFGPGAAYNVPGGAGLLAVGDLDADGDLDLMTCANGAAAAPLTLLRNDGTGVFAPEIGGIPLDAPSALALGDVEGDGDLDLATIETGSGTLRVYRNAGSGVFGGAMSVVGYARGFESPRSLALADADNDHDLDLVVAFANDTGSTNLLVYRNGGDASGSNTGAFGNAPGGIAFTRAADSPRALALGDLNADGTLDAVLLNADGTAQRLLGTGAGTFGAATPVPAAAAATALALADVDADGDLDVLSLGATGGTLGTGELMTRYNDGSGGFGTGRTAPAGLALAALTLGDVDGDGDVDALAFKTAAGAGTTGVAVFRNGPGPEINVRQGAVNYPSGSTYALANLAVGAAPVNLRFTVENQSATDTLDIASVGMTISTGLVNSFGTLLPLPVAVAPGASTTLAVTVSAPAAGPQLARLIIFSNDPDEPAYTLDLSAVGTVAPVARTWTGASGTDWATPGNWNPPGTPTAVDDATIPPVPNQPVVSAAGAECAALVADVGTTLTIGGAGHLTVNGTLTTFGALAMSDGRLELKSLFTNFYGTTAFAGGTVAFTGNGLQLIAGNNTFWNLTIGAGASYVRQDGSSRIKRILRLERDFDNGGTALFLDSDANGTAMVVNAGGVVQGLGLVQMQRHIAGPNAGLGYRHLSIPGRFTRIGQLFSSSGTGYTPVLNAAYNTLGNTARPFPTFFGYDEARQGAAGVPGSVGFDQGWVSPAGSNDAFAPGRGYTLNLPGTARPTVATGFLHTGPVPVGALSRSGTGPFAGYHLLGNPYPSPIAWDSVARPAGLDDAVYVFRSTGQYTGFYDSYVNGTGTLAGGEIAAMQGFFVRVSQPVPAFTFTDAARLTTYTNPTFQRGPAEARPLLALVLRPAAGGAAAEADHAFVYFEAGATAAPDARYDAPKLPNPGGLNLASQLGNQDYAINGLPPLGAAPLLLPLSVAVPAPGRYELAVDQLLNFGPGTRLWLRDALLGTRTPLAPGTRHAFALAGTAAPGRFAVEFGAAGALATATQLLEAQVAVWPNPAAAETGVTVAAPAGARVAVLNALGQVVRPALAVGPGGTLWVPTAGLAAGLYVVRVGTAAGEVSRRLVVE